MDTLRTTPKPDGWAPDQLRDVPADVTELAVDFETTGLRWWAGDRPCGVAAAWREGSTLRSVYYPFAHQGGSNLDEDSVRRWLRTELRGKRVLNLNTKFDAHVSRTWGVDLRGLVTGLGDVGHYAALLDDHRGEHWTRKETPYSLQALGLDYAGEGKVEGLDMSRGAHVYPAWMVTPYARRDVELVIRIMAAQAGPLEREGLLRVAGLEDAVIPAVVEMEHNAIPLDLEKLARWRAESEADLAALQRRIDEAAGRHVEFDSPLDMERLFAERGHEVTERTEKTGRPSFTSAVLERHRDDPVIALILEASHLFDLRAKFLVAYSNSVSADGKLRYSLNQLKGDQYGTVSGRFSSSQPVRGEGANIQQVYSTENQIKRTGDRYVVRELFVPPPGRLLFAADSEQIEFRLFAHYACAESILRAYAENPHADFHQVVTDIAHRFRKDLTRKQMKNCNFAIIFGAGVAKTAEMTGLSQREAEAFLRIYDRAFPEAKRLARRATELAERRGYVFTAMGRRARFPGGERAHKALNAVIQGSAADYHKLKLVALYQHRHELGFTMRATVHDEIVGDVENEAAAKRVAAFLDEATPEMPLRVPLLWSAGTGASWREAK